MSAEADATAPSNILVVDGEVLARMVIADCLRAPS